MRCSAFASLLLLTLLAGCSAPNDEGGATPTLSTPTPTPMTPPASATPSVTTVTPSPAPPTEPTPSPTPPSALAPATKRVEWEEDLTLGLSNCAGHAAARVAAGGAHASWNATGPVPTSVELVVLVGDRVIDRVQGPSPLEVSFGPQPESSDDYRYVLQQVSATEVPPAGQPVRLAYWIEIPASDGAPGATGPSTCDHVG